MHVVDLVTPVCAVSRLRCYFQTLFVIFSQHNRTRLCPHLPRGIQTAPQPRGLPGALQLCCLLYVTRNNVLQRLLWPNTCGAVCERSRDNFWRECTHKKPKSDHHQCQKKPTSDKKLLRRNKVLIQFDGHGHWMRIGREHQIRRSTRLNCCADFISY